MRILIAEDDPVIALGLAARLRRLGYEPIGPVHDGLRALATARETEPDLYLLDVDMPELDGLAVARALAEQGLRRPTVVVTGVEDPTLVERSIEAGVGAYLRKPIDERELDAAIRLSAARHRELEALEAEVNRAQQALEDRKLVERAKGLLTSGLGISEPDAFRRIQRLARDRNLRLVDVARQIVEQRTLFEDADATAPESREGESPSS